MEVNTRVNYPIKEILTNLVATDKIDMTNDVTKFCVSWVACKVSNHGLSQFVKSWNHHRIPSMLFVFFPAFTYYVPVALSCRLNVSFAKKWKLPLKVCQKV